ncbi:hypothetical protein RE6C_04083 [Rhodopirellula europaea 6C]|uniref:Uncharacterized protein n=1 Tax=Rhodopirellula europaea 6C TaxID=1263867 RepID=M2ADL5_9BACT|nr:hypothetical protein RE6C_04083 [Rhodopirellula europaea 6C]
MIRGGDRLALLCCTRALPIYLSLSKEADETANKNDLSSQAF